MTDKPNYVGIAKDAFGGMTSTGNIIRDAWAFGIIPDSETFAGWTLQGIEALYGKVSTAWESYDRLASDLPPDLRQRHQRIYEAPVRNAKSLDWDPELHDEDN